MQFIINHWKKASIGLFLLILVLESFVIIGPTERAVFVTMGQAQNDVLSPGIHLKAPFITHAARYSLSPNTYDMFVDINNRGALSADNQIIGAEAKIVWIYDSTKITELVKGYSSREALEAIINNTAYEAIKTEIGKYTVFELGKSMQKIATNTYGILKDKLGPYPIQLQQFNITNFNWSSELDKQIQATVNSRQQVEMAKAQADKAEQEQRKLSITAEATAKALVFQAEGEKKAAELRAEAKRAEGQGIADYNKLVAQNMELEIRLRQIQIEQARIEKWDGRYVSTYIPMPANGAIVSLPSVQAQK